MDLGYMELGGEGVTARIYFQQGYVPPEGGSAGDAPLINGPRGYCLDLTNTTGQPIKVTVYGIRNQAFLVNIGEGDPVTSGAGRSRTVSVINNAGFSTRDDVGMISLGE